MEEEDGLETTYSLAINCSHLIITKVPISALTLSTLSCVLSITFGSIILWLLGKRGVHIRTASMTMFSFLTIADVITAGGNLVGIVRYIVVHYVTKPPDAPVNTCKDADYVCQIQSFVTTTSNLCSFMWTLMLAFYFYYKVMSKNRVTYQHFEKMTTCFAWMCFGAPVTISVMALVQKALGENASGISTGWCWVSMCNRGDTFREKQTILFWLLICGKFWEIITYVSIGTITVRVKCYIRQENRRRQRNFTRMETPPIPQSPDPDDEAFEEESPHAPGTSQGNSMSQQESQALIASEESLFLSMPWFLYLIRIWGTIRCGMAVYAMFYNEIRCSHAYYVINMILLHMQGIGDNSQALCNFVLLMMYSPQARNLVLPRFLQYQQF